MTLPVRDRRAAFWDRPTPALADRGALGSGGCDPTWPRPSLERWTGEAVYLVAAPRTPQPHPPAGPRAPGLQCAGAFPCAAHASIRLPQQHRGLGLRRFGSQVVGAGSRLGSKVSHVRPPAIQNPTAVPTYAPGIAPILVCCCRLRADEFTARCFLQWFGAWAGQGLGSIQRRVRNMHRIDPPARASSPRQGINVPIEGFPAPGQL